MNGVSDQMEASLKKYLDGLEITSDNIGHIRRTLFMPFPCNWNSLVREETAARENANEKFLFVGGPLDGQRIATKQAAYWQAIKNPTPWQLLVSLATECPSVSETRETVTYVPQFFREGGNEYRVYTPQGEYWPPFKTFIEGYRQGGRPLP